MYLNTLAVALHLAMIVIVLAGNENLAALNGSGKIQLLAREQRSLQIKHIDVVMLSHLDVGFSDSPYLAINELQRLVATLCSSATDMRALARRWMFMGTL